MADDDVARQLASLERTLMGRMISLERTVTDFDRTLGLEMRALRAEVMLAVTNLEQAVRDLWTEHLSHSHPEEGT